MVMFKKNYKIIVVEGMHCEGCANRVQNILTMIPGVKQVKVNLEDKKAELVLSKEIDNSIFREKIESLGFTMK